MKENVLLEKSYRFALRIVNLCRYLNEEKREYVLSKEILHSGTAIGAYVEVANQGESRPDFLHNLSTANKSAFKTHFWLRLLRDSKILSEGHVQSMIEDCEELKKMLVTSVKTTRSTI